MKTRTLKDKNKDAVAVPQPGDLTVPRKQYDYVARANASSKIYGSYLMFATPEIPEGVADSHIEVKSSCNPDTCLVIATVAGIRQERQIDEDLHDRSLDMCFVINSHGVGWVYTSSMTVAS